MENRASLNAKTLAVRASHHARTAQINGVSSISDDAMPIEPEEALMSEPTATADNRSLLISTESSAPTISMSCLTSEFTNPETPDAGQNHAPDDTVPTEERGVYVLPGIAVSTLLRPPRDPKNQIKSKRMPYIRSPLSMIVSSDDVGSNAPGMAESRKRSFSPDLGNEPAEPKPKRRRIFRVPRLRLFRR